MISRSLLPSPGGSAPFSFHAITRPELVKVPSSSAKHAEYFHVDFVKHLESMGALAEKVERIEDLPAAWQRAKAADRSYAIVMDIDEYTWTEGGAWWETGVPEVSDRPEVRKVRAEWEVAKKRQRVGV